MNERIQELHQQAKDFINEVSDADGVYQGKEYPQAVREKFAELIVQDFLSICKTEGDGYYKLRKSEVDFSEKNIYAEGETACDRIRVMTKRHFGVE